MNKATTVMLCLLVGLAVGSITGLASGLLINHDFDSSARVVSGASGGIGAGAAMLVVLLRSKRSA
jgi:hypothetical protein